MPYKKPPPGAPRRLRQYLNDKMKADFMSLKDWEILLPKGVNSRAIDIKDTPFASMFDVTEVAGCIAERDSENHGQITIYRNDPKDPPDERINKYKKCVFEDLRSMPNFDDLLNRLSTDYGGSMPDFLAGTVFFFPVAISEDHHRPEISAEHQALLSKQRKRHRSKRNNDAI